MYFVLKVSKNRNDVFIKSFRFLLTFSLMVIFLEMLIVLGFFNFSIDSGNTYGHFVQINI